MTFTQLLSVLMARWRAALAVLLSVVTIVLVLSLVLPKQYTATASVLVDLKSADPIAGVAQAATMNSTYMLTQMDVIKSERVALRALRSLRLNDDAELRAQWHESTDGEGDLESWLADLLQQKLEVRPSRESNVIVVAYTAPDRQFSAAVANAFMRAYIDTTLELKVEPAKGHSNFFDDRAKQMREALEKAQTQLSAYQQQKGIVATDERLDVENTRLAELSSQLVALQAVAAESSGRQGQVSANADRMQEVLSSPIISGLTTELSRQEIRLKELGQRLDENHPQLQEARAGIAQTREKIVSETRRVSGSLGVNNNVNQARLAQLRASLDEQRDKVLRLKGQRDDAAVLLREVANAQRAYDAVLARANQTSLESQATQTNVSTLKSATPPAFPSSPRLLLNTAVAIVVGSLLALGMAVIRELRDRRLRFEDDVLELLKQPLLVVLPRAAALNGRDRSRLGLMKRRVVNSLPRTAT